MKRDIELQNPVAHTSIWLGKRESDVYENYMMPKKPKANLSNWNIKNFRHWMKCIDSKKLNDMMYMEPNEKLQSYVIKFCGGHICIFI